MRFSTLLLLAACLAVPASAQTPPSTSLLLTGVADGPLPGGLPKAVEFYAADNIANLSLYGFGSANNGGGTSGAEFVFPDTSLTAGSFIYLAAPGSGANNGRAAFLAFFGRPANFFSDAANVNGDDALELFFDANGDATFDSTEVIDTFGEIDVDGTGRPWEYLDGWAYRENNSGPDGSTFAIANWRFSGVDMLEGGVTNATTTMPFPIGTYTRTIVAGEGAPTSALALSVANPVVGTATVRFAVPTSGDATLALYSLTGRRVATLATSSGTATLDARGLAAGVYVLRLDAAGETLARLVTVVR